MEQRGIEVLLVTVLANTCYLSVYDDWGIEISEYVRVTETGSETLAAFPRKLFVASRCAKIRPAAQRASVNLLEGRSASGPCW